jgi:hypothetical protein
MLTSLRMGLGTWLVAVMAVGCGGDGDPARDDAAVVSDASATDASSADGGLESDCKAAGGICLASAEACAAGGGAHVASADEGCAFDDVPGACCVPPEANPAGATCASHGGLCAPVSGCHQVDGRIAPARDCEGVPMVCCVVEEVCGDEDVICCAPGDDADFAPECDRGTLSCAAFPGTTLVPTESCT